MNPFVSAITLAVDDLETASAFSRDGLGWPVEQAHSPWIAFKANEGSTPVGLLQRDAYQGDAGVESAGGAGLSGVMFSYVVRTEERVAEVLTEAERAGGRIIKPAGQAGWGGVTGVFADPEGFLWKVAADADSPLAAE